MYIYPLNKRGCASVLFRTVYWRVWLNELAGVMDHLANRTMDDVDDRKGVPLARIKYGMRGHFCHIYKVA